MILSDQQIRVPEKDERRALCFLGGENRAEIGVCRDNDSVLLESSCEDFLVSCSVHSVRSNVDRVISGRSGDLGQARRKCIVDQKISS